MSDDRSVTQLLHAAGTGSAGAQEQLWSTVYAELQRLARSQLAREGHNCTLQTTSLVNEAYLRLIGSEPVQWSNRRHFFAAAAQAMRRIRVDHARNRRRLKRGGVNQPQALAEEPPASEHDQLEVLAVDEVLAKLEASEPKCAEVVMLRYFAGLSIDETAAALGVSPRTVDTQWRYARAWLHRELADGDAPAYPDSPP